MKRIITDSFTLSYRGLLYNIEILNDLKNKELSYSTFIDIVNRIDGNFCLIVETAEYIFAAVDRIRSIPLFYTSISSTCFQVSDDASTLLKIQKEKLTCQLSISEYLQTGYVTGKYTLIKNIYQLQAGEILCFNKNSNKLKTTRYFEFRHTLDIEDNFTLAQSIQNLHEIHISIFKKIARFLNNRPVLIPLSGGYDSRLILAMFNEIGYRNIQCYTYGLRSDFEVKVSRKIARYYGVKWNFIPYSRKKWYNWYKTQSIKDYVKFAANLTSIAVLQDWPAILELKKAKLIPPDCFICPGHSGDFIQGSHIPSAFFHDSTISYNKLIKEIYSNHYNLLPKFCDDSIFISKISNIIESLVVFTPEKASDEYEFWDWQERQSKFIVNSVRVYDFFELNWLLPLWDKDLIAFYSKVNICNRFNRKLYFEYVKKFQGNIKIEANPQLNILQKLVNKVYDPKYGRWNGNKSILVGNIFKVNKKINLLNHKVNDFIWRIPVNGLNALDQLEILGDQLKNNSFKY